MALSTSFVSASLSLKPIAQIAMYVFLWLMLLLHCHAAPPQRPDPDLLSQFTLADRVPIEYFYVDETNGSFAHYKVGKVRLQSFDLFVFYVWRLISQSHKR